LVKLFWDTCNKRGEASAPTEVLGQRELRTSVLRSIALFTKNCFAMLSVVKRRHPRSRLYSLDRFFWLLVSRGTKPPPDPPVAGVGWRISGKNHHGSKLHDSCSATFEPFDGKLLVVAETDRFSVSDCLVEDNAG